MSDFNLPKWTQPPTLQKRSVTCFSPQKHVLLALWSQPRFLVFCISCFKTPTRKGQNGHFWWTNKCPKIGGLIPSFILAFGGFERNIFDGFVLET